MNTKLTLELKDSLIKRARKYALENKISLSRLIENYLEVLTREAADDFEISPFVKSISSGKSIPAEADWKTLREG